MHALAIAALALTLCGGGAAAQTLRVEVDTLSEATAAYERMARRQGVPLVARSVGFDITGAASDDDPADRRTRVDDWQAELVEMIAEHGFSEEDMEDVAEAAGMSVEQMREMLLKDLPYADRERMAENLLEMRALLSTRCNGPQGMIMAMVMGSYPDETRPEQHGSLLVSIIGAGACGQGAAASHVSSVASRIRQDFVASVQDN